jgi:glutaminyl-tRNA synthetase
MSDKEPEAATNFVDEVIAEDTASGKVSDVVTRFPPEPNGYLHIGHAKNVCLNFGLAQKYGGRCHLRYDDTNPAKEDEEFVRAIEEDIAWLGFSWGEHLYHTSDYFEQLHTWAQELIKDGKAYVCELSPDEMREHRGTLKEPGKESPYRDRSVEENLELFEKMKNGAFEEGKATLRAKIDMASPNMNLRDPTMYRVKKASHHRTGDSWCIYPMYDWAHGQSDAMEGVTHSICTLEYDNHRPLYDWYLDQLDGKDGMKSHPRQYEVARLNLAYTVLSKRRLKQLVDEDVVTGWDDPRMPTVAGLRRRGYTPASIREFANRIGFSRTDSWIDIGHLESAVRDDLNENAPRRMAVLRPLKVVLTNYPEDQTDEFELPNHPKREDMGSRKAPFGRELYIERDDFMEDPPKKFFRLGPGREVRLRGAYFIKCEEVVKDADGNITELRCTYDPATKGGDAPDGRKVKGTLHWVSAKHGVNVKVRHYDRLFTDEQPDRSGKDFMALINPKSLEVLEDVIVEPEAVNAEAGARFQFERQGYYCVDTKDSEPGALVFNQVVALKDSWAKIKKKGG